jgi:putative endonuclease
MLPITHFLIRVLQRIQLGRGRKARHLALGQTGETEAFFYLKQLGYRIVTTNFRAPHDRGEIDLIGWDGTTLCFIEVKTRTDDSFAPPSTAVTRSKQQHILSVAKRYVRHLSTRPPCRFDILSVVPAPAGRQFQFTLLKGAFTWHSGKARREPFRDFHDTSFRRLR